MANSNSINQITTMRLPDGNQVAFVDWTDQPLYSTCDILHGSTDDSIPLFNYVVSDDVSASSNVLVKRTATDLDTNMATPGAFASTEELLLYGVKPEFYQLVCETDFDASSAIETGPFEPIPSAWRLDYLFRRCLFEIQVSQKLKHRAALGYWPTGFGPAIALAASVTGTEATATSFDYALGNSGVPAANAARSLSVPIHIGGQEKIDVRIRNPEGSALNIGLTSGTPDAPAAVTQLLMRIRVNFEGLYKKPVS
jgi:hypothetical protein